MGEALLLIKIESADAITAADKRGDQMASDRRLSSAALALGDGDREGHESPEKRLSPTRTQPEHKLS
jgi:hypothetical protein